MAKQTVTITLDRDLVTRVRELTDNVSAYVEEVLEFAVRQDGLRREVARYEAEHGAFADSEVTATADRLFGPVDRSSISTRFPPWSRS